MAQYTIVHENIKYRMYGSFNGRSKSGTPMICISLQVVGKGTKAIKTVRFDMFNKVVKIFKDTLPHTHESFEKILNEQLTGLN